MLATPTPCLLFPSALNHRCPSLLPALHRPSLHSSSSSSSSRLSSPSSATFSRRPHTQFFVGAAQSSAQNESATAEELDVRKERLRDLSVNFFNFNLESPSSNPSRANKLLDPEGNFSKACTVPSDMSSFEILQKHSLRTYYCGDNLWVQMGNVEHTLLTYHYTLCYNTVGSYIVVCL